LLSPSLKKLIPLLFLLKTEYWGEREACLPLPLLGEVYPALGPGVHVLLLLGRVACSRATLGLKGLSHEIEMSYTWYKMIEPN
jgi:hypothetical protein